MHRSFLLLSLVAVTTAVHPLSGAAAEERVPPQELGSSPASVPADPADQEPLVPLSPSQTSSEPADVRDESQWAGTVELYGFLPWVNQTTTVRGFEADTTLDPGDILSSLESVFSARASVERGRIGLLTDVYYSQLGASASRTTPRGLLTGSADVTVINGIYDVALRYRFGHRETAVGTPGAVTVMPYAGVRILQARAEVDAEVRGNGPLGLRIRREGEVDRTWAQPLIGTQASVFLTPRLKAFARADVGGFGLAGAEDLSGNAQVGLGMAVGNSTILTLSYRYLGLAYDNGADRATGFRSSQSGIEAGLKFFF